MLYLEIDVGAVLHNISVIRKHTEAELNAVVKANCYGHGIELARFIEPHVDSFSVACIEEAKEIRAMGLEKKLYILGAIDIEDFDYIKNAVYTVCSVEDVEFLIACGHKLDVAIKVNTGMNRLGARPAKVKQMARLIQKSQNLKLDSVFTHFYNAQEGSYKEQFELFEKTTAKIKAKKHCCASTCLWLGRQYHLDMVRCGLALYGYGNKELKIALKAYSTVAQITEVKAGERVGYGNYTQEKNKKIATIRAGYADGYKRITPPPNKATTHPTQNTTTTQPTTHPTQNTTTNQLLTQPTTQPSQSTTQFASINGKPAAIVGQISMDMTAVDASGTKINQGDKVYLIDETNTAEALAKSHQTIVYEILTSFSGKRTKRTYKTP